MSIIITLILFTLIIKFVYKIKFDETVHNFVNGSKKMVGTVFLVILTYAILVSTYNHSFISTIITWVSESKLGIGRLLHTDLYYTVAGVYSPLISAVSDESMLATYAMTFQSIYGIVGIIGPTSFLLIVALKYLDVPYTSWVKYIWRFVLMLLLIVILVLLVMALI